jgi:DNA mismatch repair protein MutS
MSFASILFCDAADRMPDERAGTPACFSDLHLDQIVAAITGGKDAYDLKPYFAMPLHSVDAIHFRHEIMRDLEADDVNAAIKRFAAAMLSVREHLAQAGKLRHPYQIARWFLDAVDIYCDAVTSLAGALAAARLGSRGLASFRDFLADHVAARRFRTLCEETKARVADLDAITYGVLVQTPRVDVRLYDGEPDYSADVLATFERFKQDDVQGYKFAFGDAPEMNHIEGQILDRVALLCAATFQALDAYRDAHRDFLDPAIAAFDREVQFYIAFLDYIARLKAAGLNFCYPTITEERSGIFDREGFDLALAGKLLDARAVPVCNDFHVEAAERVIVVSGPNQGGKTTFARTFGQLHWLARLGCLVPGTAARLYLFDTLFTHFEREEDIATLRGKLQDDLVRIHDILAAASPRSLIIMNEIFASTTLRDAIVLSRKVAAAIVRLDLYCVWVTFIDEVTTMSDAAVSMVSTVAPDNPAQRTYKIVRRPADGLAYAMSIAEKYRLTHDAIMARIGS